MKKFDCLTDQKRGTKYFLLKDYGDTFFYAVLIVCPTEVMIKTDKRIKSKEDFVKLYGYNCVYSTEAIKI